MGNDRAKALWDSILTDDSIDDDNTHSKKSLREISVLCGSGCQRTYDNLDIDRRNR